MTHRKLIGICFVIVLIALPLYLSSAVSNTRVTIQKPLSKSSGLASSKANPQSGQKTLGVTTIGTKVPSNHASLRAMPFEVHEDGWLQSISIYHNPGEGHMLLGVYEDQQGRPGRLLAQTPKTVVSAEKGWQTVALTHNLSVQSGTTVWISWLFERNPGVFYDNGAPGRYSAYNSAWGNRPEDTNTRFGKGEQAAWRYSVFATYTHQKAQWPEVNALSASLEASKAQRRTTHKKTAHQSSPILERTNEPTVTYFGQKYQGISYSKVNTKQQAKTSQNASISNEGLKSKNIHNSPRAMKGGFNHPFEAANQQVLRVSPNRYSALAPRPGRPTGNNTRSEVLPTESHVATSRQAFAVNPGRAIAKRAALSSFKETARVSGKNTTAASVALKPVGIKKLGQTTVVGHGISTHTTRRAMAYTLEENALLTSISACHLGGKGHMMVGVYADLDGKPGRLLGKSAHVKVNRTAGWQKVALASPVSVKANSQVWLAWIFEQNPGIYQYEGTDGRVSAPKTAWQPNGDNMPTYFGSGVRGAYRYAIHANYAPVNKKLKVVRNTPSQNQSNTQANKLKTQSLAKFTRFTVIPNPQSAKLIIDITETIAIRRTIEVYDKQGRIQLKMETDKTKLGLDISSLATNKSYLIGVKENNSTSFKMFRVD